MVARRGAGVAMTAANTADFFGGSSTPIPKAKIYAPGDEPNPRNPGGISNNEVKRRAKAAEIQRLEKERAIALSKAKAATSAKIVRDQKEALDAANKRSGGILGDLKVLGPVVLKTLGTAAAVVATGGAAAGAIGLTAAAGVTAAATTASKAIDAINTGTKVVSSLKKGDAAGFAGAAASGLSQAGVKTPPLPNAAKLGKEAVKTALSSAKVAIPSSVSKGIAEAKKAGAAVVATVKAAAPTAAPGKAAAPKLTAAKVLTTAAGALPIPKPTSPLDSVAKLLKTAAAAPSAATRAAILGAADRAANFPVGTIAKQLTSLDLAAVANGARISLNTNGTIKVVAPAATTAAASLFKPLQAAAASVQPTITGPLTTAQLSTAAANASAFTRPTSAASATVTIKPPAAGSKPPAMTTTKPPAPSPSVLASAPAAAPPIIKPPPVSDAPTAASSGPVIEGYLVTFEGRISPTRRFRAA